MFHTDRHSMRWIGRAAGGLVVMVAALLVATNAHAGKAQPARGQLSVYTGRMSGLTYHAPHVFKPRGGLLVTVTKPGSGGTVVRQARTPSPSGHLVWNLPAGEYHVKATSCTPVGKTVTVQAHSTTTVKLKCEEK
jgi:hypothetical protein